MRGALRIPATFCPQVSGVGGGCQGDDGKKRADISGVIQSTDIYAPNKHLREWKADGCLAIGSGGATIFGGCLRNVGTRHV